MSDIVAGVYERPRLSHRRPEQGEEGELVAREFGVDRSPRDMRDPVKRDFVTRASLRDRLDSPGAVPSFTASFAHVIQCRPQIGGGTFGQSLDLGFKLLHRLATFAEQANEGETRRNIKFVEQSEDAGVGAAQPRFGQRSMLVSGKDVRDAPFAFAIEAQNESCAHGLNGIRIEVADIPL